MVIKQRRGQAALEFLTTYGWAFMVILVMIGALAYFGVLNPQQFIPERCQMSAPFSCDGQNYILRAGEDDNIIITVRNSINTRLNISNMEIRNNEGNYDIECTGFEPTIIPIDGTEVIRCDVPSGSHSDLQLDVAGRKVRINFRVSYAEVGASDDFTRTLPGEIFANVEEASP